MLLHRQHVLLREYTLYDNHKFRMSSEGRILHSHQSRPNRIFEQHILS